MVKVMSRVYSSYENEENVKKMLVLADHAYKEETRSVNGVPTVPELGRKTRPRGMGRSYTPLLSHFSANCL